MLAMEISILKTLEFDINIPVAYHFLRRYSVVRERSHIFVLPVGLVSSIARGACLSSREGERDNWGQRNFLFNPPS